MVPPRVTDDQNESERAQPSNVRRVADPFRLQFDAFATMTSEVAGRLPVRWEDHKACAGEDGPTHGFDRHYVYHTGWAARILARTRPARHIDVGSSLYFASIASAFTQVEFYDYRQPTLELSGLVTGSADLTALPWADRSIASLSCMHVIEHVGLGRYGDPLDVDGDRLALAELQRVLAPGGSLLVVVPVGVPRVVFNAHRIYAKSHICEALSELTLHGFSLIPDGRHGLGLVDEPDDAFVEAQKYGCGCFWFRRDA